MGKKKVVVPKPFHEVAFDILEHGEESEAFKQVGAWTGYGQDATVIVAFLLTRCIVPKEEQPRIVPALIAASKNVYEDDRGEVPKAVAYALTHFKLGNVGLKWLEKRLSAEYLKTEKYSDEESGLEDIFNKLRLKVPKRPKE